MVWCIIQKSQRFHNLRLTMHAAKHVLFCRNGGFARDHIAELEKEKEKYSVGFGSKMQWALLIEKYKDQESLDAEMAAAFIETLTLFNDGHVEVAFRHRDEIEQVLYVAATRGKEAERYAG